MAAYCTLRPDAQVPGVGITHTSRLTPRCLSRGEMGYAPVPSPPATPTSPSILLRGGVRWGAKHYGHFYPSLLWACPPWLTFVRWLAWAPLPVWASPPSGAYPPLQWGVSTPVISRGQPARRVHLGLPRVRLGTSTEQFLEALLPPARHFYLASPGVSTRRLVGVTTERLASPPGARRPSTMPGPLPRSIHN